MIDEISAEIRNVINSFSDHDSLILNNNILQINKDNFTSLTSSHNTTKIAFIDGGQAEIISTGNFCLSFIRVASLIFTGTKKETITKEFYLFTKAIWHNDDLFYTSKIFGDKMVEEQDLFLSSNDVSIKVGSERAPIAKIANMARRFAELSLASTINSDFVVIDGTLEKTFTNEGKYLEKFGSNVCSLAKSSSLFTTSGNSPVVLLNKLGPVGCWSYHVDAKTKFVKLHEKSKHVFRFEGDSLVLPHLLSNSCDALFLGYPYGLLAVDRVARVTNNEVRSLKAKFLLNKQNEELVAYLSTTNAHSILDRIG